MDTREVPARYLRKEFGTEPEKEVVRATAYVCGLGFFDFFLNGEKVSNHVMDPALSDYRKAAYYVTFDVTEKIHSGANAIGVILGNGRFMAPRTRTPAATQTFGFPKLLAQVEIEYSDGSKQTVVSDASWKITDNGPIRSNNEYDGEHYDARMEMPGWNETGFDASGWKDVEMVAAPGGELVSQLIEPMRVTRVVEPVSISSPSPGTYIVDMGEAFYGTVRLKASAPAGTTVKMTSAYSLLPDGNLKTADNRDAKCTDQYIFKGSGLEVWNPRFKGQGFRRVEVTGFPGEPALENFEALVIHTDVEMVGSFECSNPLINDIHASLLRGAKMFLRSAPLDPDRDERQAWMGDSSKNAEFEAYNFNVAPFYSKWMDDVQRSQRADGSIPDVSMYWDWGEGVEWPAVFTIIPDWFIDFYGDSRVAGSHYEAMKTWVLAMRRHEEPDGTLRSSSYGDWCDVSTMFKTSNANGATPGDLISSAYQYRNYRIMERLAERSGLAGDEALFAGLASHLKGAFNARFFDSATHVYHGDTQCAYVLALQFGLVPDEHRQAVIDKLVDHVMLRNKGHLSVGLIGMQWLMQTLTDVGRPDVAWSIVTRTERPGWGYMLSKGATTIWERWDGDTKDGVMNSESLLILAGNLDGWFYQTLAGIRPTSEGFKTFEIRPELLGNLEWAKAEFDSPHGLIASHWTIDSPQSVTLDAKVPVNTSAIIHFPVTKLRNAVIREGDLTLWKNGEFVGGDSAIRFDGANEHEVRFSVGSGGYRFRASGWPVPSSGFSVIVDDDDPGAAFTGDWTRATGTEADQRYGFSFRYAPSGDGSMTAKFRPVLPESGNYRVYALWTTHANRATNTPVTIRHAGGETVITVNQELNGGVWNELGTFEFNADNPGFVEITNAANQYVIADAVKFERVVDEGEVSAYDGWIRGFFPAESDPEVIGRHADPDEDGVSNLLEFALNGDPGDGGDRGLVRLIPGSSGTELGVAVLREGQLTELPEGPIRIEATDAGITYFVEGSIDLVDWTLPVTRLRTADHAFGELPDLGTTPWTYHSLSLDHPGSGETPEKGFLRVRVPNHP
ncbi:family 78 glycoside hydrolase catalytic domain [Haloferula sargassicola]